MANVSKIDLEFLEAAADDEAAQALADTASLELVQTKANRLIQIEIELDDAEKKIKELKKEREGIRIRELPILMTSLSLPSFGVGNKTVEVEPLIQATLPKEPDKRREAVDWLQDIGSGGVVNRTLSIDVKKRSEAIEHQLLDAIRAVDPSLTPTVEYNVHHATYQATLKKLVSNGTNVPLDKMGVYVGRIARIK